jgi:hypothetical protein
MKKKVLVIGHKHTEAPMVNYEMLGDTHIGSKKISKKEIDIFLRENTNHHTFFEPKKLNLIERIVLWIVGKILWLCQCQ